MEKSLNFIAQFLYEPWNQNVKVCRARGLQSLIALKKLKGSLGENGKYRSFPTEITLLAGFLIS